MRCSAPVERIDGTHRYRVTDTGLRVALFFTRTYARVLRPGLAIVMPEARPGDSDLRRQFDKLEQVMDQFVAREKLAA
jgi:hypothetical protein